MDNRDRRKELGKVFFDVSKYLITAVVIASLLGEKVNLPLFFIGLILALITLLLGYFITPKNKGDC
ncbi:MAG: hypothetical protein N2738_01185 [Thermodesulfovibrionales bacterium]|nr:hypothetical protein [Thermodesulfovibrionales bacterium]